MAKQKPIWELFSWTAAIVTSYAIGFIIQYFVFAFACWDWGWLMRLDEWALPQRFVFALLQPLVIVIGATVIIPIAKALNAEE